MSKQKLNWLGSLGEIIHQLAVIYIFGGLLGWLPSNPATLVFVAGIALLSLWLHFRAEGTGGVFYSWLSLFSSIIQIFSILYVIGGILRAFPSNTLSLVGAGLLFLLSLFLESRAMNRARLIGYNEGLKRAEEIASNYDRE